MSGNGLIRGVFIIVLLVNLMSSVKAQICNHKPAILSPKNRLHVNRTRVTQSRIISQDQGMKFHVDYHQSVLDLSVAAELQDVVAEIVVRISRTLSVKQDPGFFLIPKSCTDPDSTVTSNGRSYCTVGSCYTAVCGEVEVPENLAEPCYDCDDDGSNCIEFGGTTPESSALSDAVHFTLFVGSLSTSCEENVIAYASACYIDDTTDRPLAGYMNICPIGLQLERERLLSVVQHEIFHALGFSPGLYGLFRDADGNPLTPREANGFPPQDPETFLFQWGPRVIQELSLEWDYVGGTTQRTVQAFVTPNILREARAHFGCPSLMGLEIEDGGGAGTALAHFEKRVLATESMNGFLTPVRVFSRISLALMEDTGWYIPDYDLADKLNWGKDLGCDFVQKSCKNWIDTKMNAGLSFTPWCNGIFETACHAEGVDVATCSFYVYDEIPPIFQIFTELPQVNPANLPFYGGSSLSDYCPYHEVDINVPRNQTANDLVCTNHEIINDCRVSECMNGGVCRDVISGYYCDCPVGFAGALCDHVNVECTGNSNCNVNEVCTDNQCVCERDRIRDQNDVCIGVEEVKEYSMTVTVSEVNGEPAVYDPSLMGTAGDEFRHGLEYEIRQIIGRDASLTVALIDVVTRSLSSGSIIADLALIFRDNTSDPSMNITEAAVVAATTTDESVLSEGGTAFTVVWNESTVQDANECNDAAGNDCSQYAMCTNTDGSYECSCFPGYEDAGQAGGLVGRNCIDTNECSSSPCMHEGTCTDLVNMYQCMCLDGYQGVNCETDLNECSSNPCLNGATCTDEPNGYSCTCVDGYSGDTCGTDLNECSSNPCINGATCMDEINGYSCTCAGGYSGDDCGMDLNECSSNPCLNGATCTDEPNGYTCTCVVGYSGNDCGTDLNECSSNPCLNGATCMDGVNAYSCVCVDGYSGDDCGTDLNECSSNPCLNGATCSDQANGYSCTCADGYSGNDCGTDLNECSSNPCLNGATCMDGVNGYSCTCVDGYSGNECGTDLNECSSNPCLNGATCTDEVNGYSCTCADGYSGDDCGTDEDECLSFPCVNGGSCSSLANRYICECTAGYIGDQCQTAPVTCTHDNMCGDTEICNSEGMCECGPDYVQNEDGQCQVAYFFEVTLTITSLNGVTIEFTAALTDITSQEYNTLAIILRRLLLLQVRLLRRLARILFRNGSVVAVMEAGVGEPMTAANVQEMIISDLGNGNITSGGSSIGVDPATLSATDVNECLTASENDCSPSADCMNVEGSYTCRCRSSYDDESPVASRPGRVCTVPGGSGLSPGAIIALSVGLGVVGILFLILCCISCVFMETKARLLAQEHVNPRSPHHIPSHHPSRHGSRKTLDRDLYGTHASPHCLSGVLYGDYEDRKDANWYLRDGRGPNDSPLSWMGHSHYTPQRGSLTRPPSRSQSRNHHEPRYSASPIGRQPSSRHVYEEPLPPYSRRPAPAYDYDNDDDNRPYYVSRY